MTSHPTYAVRHIVDAAAVIIAANLINEYVRTDPGGGSLLHIFPVKREFCARQHVLASERTPALPPELAQLLTGQLPLLWQATVKQAEA